MSASSILKAFLLCCSLLAFDVVGSSLEQAEKAYHDGDFSLASQIYLDKIGQNQHLPGLYYNLGVSFYQEQKIGPSLAAFAKAVQLEPSRSDAVFNLHFILAKLGQNADFAYEKSLLYRMSLRRWLSERQIFWLSISTLLLGIFATAIPRLLDRSSRIHWLRLIAAFVFNIPLLFSLGEGRFMQNDWGSIHAKREMVRASPSLKNDVTIFEVQEGILFQVIAETGDWMKIKLADERTGWLLRESVVVFGERYFSYRITKN